MSTSDTIAFWGAVAVATQAVIFIVQTGLLCWYAWETRRLRLDAAHQNNLILQQIENSTAQNTLITGQIQKAAEQNGILAAGLKLQQEALDREAQDRAQAKEQREKDDDADIRIAPVTLNTSLITFAFENIRKNAHFLEFRSSDTSLRLEAVLPLNESTLHKRTIVMQQLPKRVALFGIKYATRLGYEKAQVFELSTDGVVKRLPDYDYATLPVR